MILNSPYISGSLTVTGNATIQGSISGTITGSATSASYAQTASSIANLNQNVQITGSLTTNGTITAQTLVVQTVTSSVVYSSGSNIFGNSQSNIQQMTGSLRVTGSGNHYILGGNVGIGYNSPTVALQVSGTIAVGNATTTGWGRFLYDTATNQVRIQASKDGTDSIGLSFYTQASGGGFAERMIISGSNVGIGTSTPGSILHVKGGSAGGDNFGAELRVWENSFGAVLQGSTNATTEAFVGNFRYNFITPANSVTNYYQAGHGILFYDGVHIFASNPGGSSGGTFTPAERLTVLNSGYVGIGVTNPITKLSVAGSIAMGNNTDGTTNLSYGGKISAKQTQVTGGAGATLIHRGLGSVGYFILVSGIGGPSNTYRFTDLIYGTGTNTPSVLASSTVGSAPTRTYSISSENIYVALSGGDTYTVTTTGLGAMES